MRLNKLSSNWKFKDEKTRSKVNQIVKYKPNTIGTLLKNPIDSGLRTKYVNGLIVQ